MAPASDSAAGLASAYCLTRRSDGVRHVFCRIAGAWRRTDREDVSLTRAGETWHVVDGSGSRIGWLAEPPAEAAAEDAADGPPAGAWRCSGEDLSDGAPLPSSALVEEYRRQEALRPWDDLLRHLEAVVGAPSGLVYDLGCGAGAVAARFPRRASVIGVDLDPQMVACSKLHCPDSRFRTANLGSLRGSFPEPWPAADGVWSSFAAAYFPGGALDSAILEWSASLKPGGWMCLVEIDGLFSAHGPLADFAAGFQAVDRGLASKGYDAFAGRRLASACAASGLRIRDQSEWTDRELYFEGPAGAEQLAAWKARLSRPGIAALCDEVFGPSAGEAREAFLGCLTAVAHAARGRVKMVVCSKPEEAA